VILPARKREDFAISSAAPQPQVDLRDPVQLLAFGFGSGLAPRAPGTAGTVAALPLYLLLSALPLAAYTAVVLAAAVLGVLICGVASRRLGVHDHPGIVWDEFVGLWIALWAVPVTPAWVLAGFVLFRFFDIVKPWPIKAADRNVTGGVGIMLDDILAGVATCGLLHLALQFVGTA
jgi:phosphatidylglycerophosphatase A